MTDELNLLRSLLHSDEHLQIHSSGDFDRICLKLNYDINITFFTDLLDTSTQSLLINNIHDLRIHQSTTKDLLNNKQWINIRDYFDQLLQQSNSDTSLYLIIQSIQEYITQIVQENSKSNEKQSSTTISISKEDASTPRQKFRGADLIFHRIMHDTTIDRSKVIIGYEDRFTGIHEIAFNDFKKVHEDEYGIPLHRIRYFKINGRLIWDRKQKYDILTGYETIHDIEEKPNLVEGMYRFDQSSQQWILCPHLSLISDDIKNVSMDDMCLPERCQFITWNILFDYYHSELIYTHLRYQEILKTLKSFLPDIICLQEVTIDFLNLLLDEQWVRENNYSIIIMGNIVDGRQKQPYGQLMLTKNFRARAFSICPFYLTNDSTSERKKPTEEYIIARFGLNSTITIDLVNLHLCSDCTYNAGEQRRQTLEEFVKTMNTQNYMLIGDFNFGDDHIKEQNILHRYQYKIIDLWKDIYDIDENPGYTFDSARNICAQITAESPVSLRLDRYLLHVLQNLSYSIEHLNMIGLETISIDSSSKERINQSDHFGLQLIINFRIRKIDHHSALAILPSMNISPLIESFRQQYDPLFHQWPPHINLFWPFFQLTNTQDDEEKILLPLRLILAQYESFDIEIDEIDSMIENHSIFMKLNSQSIKYVKQLYEQIKQLFAQCLSNNENNFHPHITIAQFDSSKKQNRVKSTLTLSKPIQFPVRYVYILQQSINTDIPSFHIAYQIPLGAVLQPIGLNQNHCISFEMEEFFKKMNLYENEKSYERKREKFHRLSICFEEIFNKNTLNCFTHAFLPYGSFRLGLNGEDLDTVFVLSKQKSVNKKTDLDQTFLRLQYDTSELNNLLLDILDKQIQKVLSNEIHDCRRIQAIYPIISIIFNDQTRVEIFVQIKEISILNEQYPHETSLLSNFHEPIHGLHDIERLITCVRCPVIFQYFLTFIRTWAQNVGLYGQVYGYLGGYSWALLCAYICHRFLPLNISQISLEQLFMLIQKFFSTYSHFNWLCEAISLYNTRICSSDQSYTDNRGSMRILCPTPPFNNSARATINSTCYLIIQGFRHVHEIINKTKDYTNTLEEILQLTNQFPDETIQSILQLTLSGETLNELNQWLGYMKSRLAHFLTDCEDDCHLFVQTDTKIEIRKGNFERFYSIAFQENEQILSRHRQFYYTLNKFLEQFKFCSIRSETMKISYKLMSKHQWNIERIQI